MLRHYGASSFLGGSVVKNPLANVGNMGLNLHPGRSYMPQSYKAHVQQLLTLCSRALELQLLSSCAATAEAHKPWSPCSLTRAATPRRSLHTATREQPPLSATREKPEKQWGPSTVPQNHSRDVLGASGHSLLKLGMGKVKEWGVHLGNQFKDGV